MDQERFLREALRLQRALVEDLVALYPLFQADFDRLLAENARLNGRDQGS